MSLSVADICKPTVLRTVPARGSAITYSINDAVKVSGLGRAYLYVQMKAGEIEFRKIGKRRLVVARSLEDFIERGQPVKVAA